MRMDDYPLTIQATHEGAKTVNVGTIGHVSGDKTTLIAALLRMIEHDSVPVTHDNPIEYTLSMAPDESPAMYMPPKPRKSKRVNRKQKERGF